MKNNRLSFISRLLLPVSAIGILVISIFFHDPGHDPSMLGITPLPAQVLVYGGVALLLAVYTWFWPVFGGTVTALYGLYKIFGHPFNIFAGHNPFERNLFTLTPEPLYYALYGLFVLGGLLCIVTGWKYRKRVGDETELSERLRGITLRISFGIAGTALVFSLVILVSSLASSYAPDHLFSSLFVLVPVVLLLSLVTRYRPAQGGLLEIVAGIFWLALGMIPNWDMFTFLLYTMLCIGLMTGGSLNIIRGYKTRIQHGVTA